MTGRERDQFRFRRLPFDVSTAATVTRRRFKAGAINAPARRAREVEQPRRQIVQHGAELAIEFFRRRLRVDRRDFVGGGLRALCVDPPAALTLKGAL